MLYSCSPPGNGYLQGLGDLFGFPKVIEGHGLFVKGVIVFLEKSSHADRILHFVGTVGIRVERNLVSQCLADMRDELFGAAGNLVLDTLHAAADTDLDRFGASLCDESAKDIGFLFRCIPPVATRPIDGDVALANLPKEFAQGHAADLADQIQHRHLQCGLTNPERKSLPLVIAVEAVKLLEQALNLAGVFSNEEFSNAAIKDRVAILESQRIGRRDALGAVL